MRAFLEAIYYPLQWTWGIIQNLVGLVIYLIHIGRPHYRYRRSIVTVWNRAECMSMGMFLFLSPTLRGEEEDEESEKSQVLVHEYGHTFQSMLLGPFYLLGISAVSGIWCMFPVFDKMRAKKKISYYHLYTERWANHLGRKVTKRIPHGYWETHKRPPKVKEAEGLEKVAEAGNLPNQLKEKGNKDA